MTMSSEPGLRVLDVSHLGRWPVLTPAQEQRFDARPCFAGEKIANLRNDGRWYQEFAPCCVQVIEQSDTRKVI
jgi:hypothetical protein